MNDVLQKKLNSLPKAPGVYQMLDSSNKVIYIGKSKCLKNRVHSYFVSNPKWEKAKRMVPKIEDIEIIVTDTHLEAMMLECKKIKEIKPYYNVLMKHEGGYCYLTAEKDSRRKPLKVTINKEEDSYGPFRKREQAEKAAALLENLYPLDKEENHYHFQYHVLPRKMSLDEFEKNRNCVKELFSDHFCMEIFCAQLKEHMEQAISAQRFERAAKYRDLLKALQRGDHQEKGYDRWAGKSLIYAAPLESGYKLLYIWKDQIIAGKKIKHLSEKSVESFKRSVQKQIRERKITEIQEKSRIDYRDILCRELSKAKKELIFEILQ